MALLERFGAITVAIREDCAFVMVEALHELSGGPDPLGEDGRDWDAAIGHLFGIGLGDVVDDETDGWDDELPAVSEIDGVLHVVIAVAYPTTTDDEDNDVRPMDGVDEAILSAWRDALDGADASRFMG